MTNAVAVKDNGAAILEQVVIEGDLRKLSNSDRVDYYNRVCESLGLNPFTKPFDYISLNNKLTLYAKRNATDQLRKLYGVSITISAREKLDDLYTVTARATDRDGRVDESTGVVSLQGLKGEKLANALMKAETKAKRRVTLSLVGLGWLDETEVSTIRDARPAQVDAATGEIDDPPWPIPDVPEDEPEPQAAPQRRTRPFPPNVLRELVGKKIASFGTGDAKPTRGTVGACVGALDNLFTSQGASKDSATMMRHTLTASLLGEGKGSSKTWTDAECQALLAWSQDNVDGAWLPNDDAIQEAALVVKAAEVGAGQAALAIPEDDEHDRPYPEYGTNPATL